MKSNKVLTHRKTRSSGSTSEMKANGGGSLRKPDDVVIAMGEVRPSRSVSR